jgi:hypothetical protein
MLRRGGFGGADVLALKYRKQNHLYYKLSQAGSANLVNSS